MTHPYLNGIEPEIADALKVKDMSAQTFEPTADRMIALSTAKSLKRIADALERAESKLLSDTSRGFFRKIVAFVMAAPVPTKD